MFKKLKAVYLGVNLESLISEHYDGITTTLESLISEHYDGITTTRLSRPSPELSVYTSELSASAT